MMRCAYCGGDSENRPVPYWAACASCARNYRQIYEKRGLKRRIATFFAWFVRKGGARG